MLPDLAGFANPLLQQLLLHGTAVVQMASWRLLSPNVWSLPTLEAYLAKRKHWQAALATCRSFCPRGQAPVISPCRHFLSNVRRKQPKRWLILCQTPFERHPPFRVFRNLCQPVRSWVWWFQAETGLPPLLWLDRWPRGQGKRFIPMQQFPVHPWAQCLEILRLQSPDSEFWPREDGRIIQQMSIFSPWAAPRQEPKTAVPRDRYDQLVQRALLPIQGHVLVCASNGKHLRWFARDVVRMMGMSRSVVWAPDWPDRRDPRKLFILMHDRLLKHRVLPRYWPILHLDGGQRVVQYRQARLPGSNHDRWKSPISCEKWAALSYQNHRLIFTYKMGRWCAWRGERLPTRESNEVLNTRLNTLAALSPHRKIPFLLDQDREY